MTDENTAHKAPITDPAMLILLAKEGLDRSHPGPTREKAMVHTKLDEALLWLSSITSLSLLAVVVALVAATSGCASFTSGLADMRTGIQDFEAGLSAVCPKDRKSDLCTAGREWYVAADELYQGGVLADQTGKDFGPIAQQFWNSLQNGWSSILALFGREKTTAPSVEEMAVVVSPAPTDADLTKSWEEATKQPAAAQ
jgi:hypothetical protein